MLSQSTNLGEAAHFHPPMRVLPPSELEPAIRRLAARAGATQLRRVPAKQMNCKTCLGQACIGRCRFGD